MGTYAYSIFDSYPIPEVLENVRPTHEDLKIEAGSDEKALREASNLFRLEAPSLKVGQKLYALVWNTSVHSYWTIVGILTLTVEELGGGPEENAR